jgi:conjugal transfer pilus assembly protein TraD
MSLKIKSDSTALGMGYSIDDEQKRKNYIYIPDSDRKAHFWCFGTTRVGKTRLMENMIIQDIKKGQSVVVIDPKGDVDLLSNIISTALEVNREEDLMYISPIYPDYSAIVDPLSHYYMPEELVANIISGVDVKEPFFYNVAYEISLMVVLALIEKQKYDTRDKKGFSLLDIKNYISHSSIEELTKEIETFSLSNDKIRQLYSDLQKIVESPQDYYAKVSSSLRVALTELTSGNIGRIIGKADSNRFIQRLEDGKSVILVVQLGSLLTHKAAFTVGKVIISMIGSFVGRIFSSGKNLNPPLALYIDEAQNVMYFGIDDLFAKAGGAGVWIHGFCQSVNQLYSELGEQRAKTILDNTNTKIFMRVPDVDTATYASKHFGTIRKLSPIIGVSGGVSSREEEVDTVPYETLLNLKPRVFYMLTYKGRFKCKTLDTEYVMPNLKHFRFIVKFPKIKTFVKNKQE